MEIWLFLQSTGTLCKVSMQLFSKISGVHMQSTTHNRGLRVIFGKNRVLFSKSPCSSFFLSFSSFPLQVRRAGVWCRRRLSVRRGVRFQVHVRGRRWDAGADTEQRGHGLATRARRWCGAAGSSRGCDAAGSSWGRGAGAGSQQCPRFYRP